MQIGANKVVAIDYTLTDEQGQKLDSSSGRGPLTYVHGSGAIIPGLESALDGKSVGDAVQVTVSPDEAYGPRNEGLCQQVPREQFGEVEDLSLGMQFRVQTNNGDMVITVVEIDEETVTVDGNHPLAGATLNFDVTIRDIRPATQEEIDHGHVHGPEGHEH